MFGEGGQAMTDLEKTIAFLESEELYYLEECDDCEAAKHYGRAIMILKKYMEGKNATTD
jgi:hypothetical protein